MFHNSHIICFKSDQKKMLQVFPMNWDWQVIQKWLPSLCTPLVNLLVAKAIESFCYVELPCHWNLCIIMMRNDKKHKTPTNLFVCSHTQYSFYAQAKSIKWIGNRSLRWLNLFYLCLWLGLVKKELSDRYKLKNINTKKNKSSVYLRAVVNGRIESHLCPYCKFEQDLKSSLSVE